jgi:DNA-binding MarR family transcriptional regulator
MSLNSFVCTIFAYRKLILGEGVENVEATEPRFGAELLRLTRRCRGIDKYVSSRAQLTIDELHCLSVLFSEHPSSVKRLSELINVSTTRASKILKDLEQRGYVSRTPDAEDRRKEQVLLTETGSLKVQRIVSFYTEVGSELITSWRHELAQDFSWLLQTVNQAK